jgi:pimeloyl-ACP methyl ester carboxylesterase
MDSPDTIFGPYRASWQQWNPYVVIRHGIISDDTPFQSLANFIQTKFPNAIIDNQRYPWTDSVALNGARLAKALHTSHTADERPVVLIGHSMGGLVCRVANLLLRDPGVISGNRQIFQNYFDDDRNALTTLLGLGLQRYSPMRVNLLVTIGTPNSGAMLKAQLSALADLLRKVISVKFPSLKDLNTARLFQLLQYFAVDTPTLSISGSGWNRFKKSSTPPVFWVPHAAASFNLPNDMIVEDRSVDLSQSILPNELLSHPAAKYLHLRMYRDCTDVIHTTMYNHAELRSLLVDCMARV